ncbi:unnamed protein product, partial [Brassica rapa subsp. narinosa]
MLRSVFFTYNCFLQKILLSCFNLYEPDNIAREANEELSKPQATIEPNHVYQSIPCGEQIQSLSSTFPPQQ